MKILSNVKDSLVRAGIMLTTFWLGVSGSFCSDAFAIAEGATDNLQTKLISLGYKLFPLSIIIVVISLFLTHDEKKLAMEVKILVALCVIFGLLILVQKGVIVPTIQNIVG